MQSTLVVHMKKLHFKLVCKVLLPGLNYFIECEIPWFLPTPKISHLLFLHVNKKEAYFTFHLMSTHWVFWMWKALNFISDVLNVSLCCGGLRPASAHYWELSNVLWVVSNENSQRTLIWWTELRFHNHSMIGARLDCENIIKKAKGRKKVLQVVRSF